MYIKHSFLVIILVSFVHFSFSQTSGFNAFMKSGKKYLSLGDYPKAKEKFNFAMYYPGTTQKEIDAAGLQLKICDSLLNINSHSKDQRIPYKIFKEYQNVDFVFESIRGKTDLQSSKKFIQAKLNGHFGVLDTNGNIILPFKYDEIAYVRNDEFLVRKAEKYGIINSKNEIIINFKYDDLIHSDLNNLFIASISNKYGVIDHEENNIIPFLQ